MGSCYLVRMGSSNAPLTVVLVDDLVCESLPSGAFAVLFDVTAWSFGVGHG